MSQAAGRPTAITVLAILSLLGGAFGLLGGLGVVLAGGVLTAVLGPLAALVPLLGLLLVAMSVLNLVVGIGFWTLRPWAWTLGVWLQLIGVAFALVNIAGFGDVGNFVITTVIALVILYFLDGPATRTAFAAPTAGFPVVGTALDPLFARVRTRA